MERGVDSKKQAIRKALMEIQKEFSREQIQLFVLSGKQGNMSLADRGILLPQKSEMNVLELNVIVDDCCTNELHKKAVMLNGCSYYITNVQASSYYGINPSAGAYVKPTGGATAVAAQQPHGIIVVKTADLITLAVYTAPTSPAAAVFVVEMFAAKLAEGGH